VLLSSCGASILANPQFASDPELLNFANSNFTQLQQCLMESGCVLDTDHMIMTSQAQAGPHIEAAAAAAAASSCSNVYIIGLASGCTLMGMGLGAFATNILAKRKLTSAYSFGGTPTPGGAETFDMLGAVDKAGGRGGAWGGSGLGHPAQQPVI
jgi:hypothetical protein